MSPILDDVQFNRDNYIIEHNSRSFMPVPHRSPPLSALVVGATGNMIAKMLGLDDSLVGRVLMVGVPMMVYAGAEDPGIGGRLFGNSKRNINHARYPCV